MAEVIGQAIHGGNIVIRERVNSMWEYLPADVRRKTEAALMDAARKACPWAPRKLTVAHGQAADYYYYLTIRLTVPDRVRADAVEERLAAAERSRCGCGYHGSWDESVSGTSGTEDCVWAGCPNCSGQAIGRPILVSDLTWYERHAGVTVAR